MNRDAFVEAYTQPDNLTALETLVEALVPNGNANHFSFEAYAGGSCCIDTSDDYLAVIDFLTRHIGRSVEHTYLSFETTGNEYYSKAVTLSRVPWYSDLEIREKAGHIDFVKVVTRQRGTIEEVRKKENSLWSLSSGPAMIEAPTAKALREMSIVVDNASIDHPSAAIQTICEALGVTLGGVYELLADIVEQIDSHYAERVIYEEEFEKHNEGIVLEEESRLFVASEISDRKINKALPHIRSRINDETRSIPWMLKGVNIHYRS